LHIAEGQPRAVGHLQGDEEHDRQQDQCAYRQRPIQQKHSDHDAAKHEDVGCKLDEAVGENGVDGFSVVGHPAHDVARPMPVMISHRQGLDMCEQLGADVRHQTLCDINHQYALQHQCNPTNDVNHQHDQGSVQQTRHIAGDDVAVDGNTNEDRPGQSRRRADQDQQRHNQNAQAVGAQVGN